MPDLMRPLSQWGGPEWFIVVGFWWSINFFVMAIFFRDAPVQESESLSGPSIVGTGLALVFGAFLYLPIVLFWSIGRWFMPVKKPNPVPPMPRQSSIGFNRDNVEDVLRGVRQMKDLPTEMRADIDELIEELPKYPKHE